MGTVFKPARRVIFANGPGFLSISKHRKEIKSYLSVIHMANEVIRQHQVYNFGLTINLEISQLANEIPTNHRNGDNNR